MALKNNIIKIVTLVFALTLFPTLAMAADYIIDVRTPQEYATDHIPGHLNIAHSQIVEGVKALNITPEDHIYCIRSLLFFTDEIPWHEFF